MHIFYENLGCFDFWVKWGLPSEQRKPRSHCQRLLRHSVEMREPILENTPRRAAMPCTPTAAIQYSKL